MAPGKSLQIVRQSAVTTDCHLLSTFSPGRDSKLSSAFSELMITSFKTIYSNVVQYSVSGAELFNAEVMGPGDLLVAKKTLLITG